MNMNLQHLLNLLLVLTVNQAIAQRMKIDINEQLQNTTRQLIGDFDKITPDRREKLTAIGDFLLGHASDTSTFSALFVCTHNSRRSHMADTWFKYGLVYFDIQHFESYSGGLEATAFNPNAIAALQRAGFEIAYDRKADNPVVSITPGHYPVWQMKSKVYTHHQNPRSNFVAIMVCTDADESCPLVEGASGRFSLPFDDPRHFDNTPAQNFKYDETVAIIGREMLFLTHYLKDQMVKEIESGK